MIFKKWNMLYHFTVIRIFYPPKKMGLIDIDYINGSYQIMIYNIHPYLKSTEQHK